MSNKNITYEVITQEDPVTGDMMLPIPIEILNHLSWKEGDELSIDLDSNNNIILSKK